MTKWKRQPQTTPDTPVTPATVMTWDTEIEKNSISATRTTHQKRKTCQKHPLSSGNQFSATAATQNTQTTQIIQKSIKAFCGIKVEVRKVKSKVYC